jgi:hypothetical protein
MAGDSGNERQSRRKDRNHSDHIQNLQSAKLQYHPTGDDRYPFPPRPSHSEGPQTIHRTQFPSYGTAPPNCSNYGSSPFLPTQSSYYGYYPSTTVDPYTQKSGAHFHPRPGSINQSDKGYGQPRSSQSESVSESAGLVPTIVEPRQGSRPQ